jgi:hypothetical protein
MKKLPKPASCADRPVPAVSREALAEPIVHRSATVRLINRIAGLFDGLFGHPRVVDLVGEGVLDVAAA